MNNPLWSCIILDHELKIVEVLNLDNRLFFGRGPLLGQTLEEAVGIGNCQWLEVFEKGIEKSRIKQRNSSFAYRSTSIEGEVVRVCTHVKYQEGDIFSLYLTELYEDDCLGEASVVVGAPLAVDFAQLKKEYEMFYREHSTIFNSLPVGVAVYGSDGVLLYFNEACSRIFGADADQVRKGQVNIYQSPVLPLSIKEAVRNAQPICQDFLYDFSKLAETGYVGTFRNDICQLECNGRAILNEKGKMESYVFIITDITEKKQNEEDLRRNRQKTEIAMSAAGVVLWEFDLRTKLFCSYNEPLNGYNEDQTLSIEEYLKSIHPDDHSIIADQVIRVFEGEPIDIDFEFRIHLPGSPDWQYCSLNGSPYEFENGQVVKYVGIRKNNTVLYKRKQLQGKILNEIPLSIFIKDVENDSRYLFCNEESRRLFGIDVDGSISDVMDAESVERIRKTDLDVYRTGDPYQGVEHVSLKDGRIYDTIVRKSVIEEDGKRLLLSIRWDQSLQNDLLRRSKLLSLTLEAMNAFTWFYEPHKDIVSFSDDFDKYGRKGARVNTLATFVSCVHPDDASLFVNSLQEVLEKETAIWELEYRFDRSGDGTYSWWKGRGILETTIRDEMPYKYMFGMTICVDKYKQAEQVLLEKREELKGLVRQNELILNNTNSGLAYITKDYIVQWENISICSASISFEAYKRGEHCYWSAHNRITPCENCVLQRAIESREMEYIQFTLDNNRRVEILATPVFDEESEFEGIVIRMDDITDREMMIEELKQAKALAEQSDRLKSAFLANMSHEIRTPLNAIIGFSELIVSITDEAERKEYIAIIRNNNDLLLKLINDVLDLSKIEASSIEFVYDEFDLSDYFNSMFVSMRQRIINPNVCLIATNRYKSCVIKQDRNRIAQLMTNYVTNSIKFTSKGFIEMGYECVEMGIRFYVKDSGIGIQEDKKDRVFQRFAKLNEFAQGTGLGLSICKAIAESMGGQVGFESKYGEGSEFWVFLPCETEFELGDVLNSKIFSPNKPLDYSGDCMSASSKLISSIVPVRKIVLVVEDIKSNYLLITSLLKKDYDLLFALNGKLAVEMVRDNSVDLVLMDMKMPVMDGLTATREIRMFNSDLPIVALTAHAFDSDRQAALVAGCNEYLVKPVDRTRLKEVLDRYFLPVSE